jgi:hypothetical protein
MDVGKELGNGAKERIEGTERRKPTENGTKERNEGMERRNGGKKRVLRFQREWLHGGRRCGFC